MASNFTEDAKARFGTADLYEILALPTEKKEQKKLDAESIKKAYYRASLKFHPDRNSSDEATQRFQIVSKAYTVLSDPDARKAYDETGCIDDENFGSGGGDWDAVWRKLFKPITEEDIAAFKEEYKDSDEERRDIAEAYASSGGSVQAILDSIFLANVIDDEERVAAIVKDMISKGELEDLPAFSNESKAKKNKRRKAAEREAVEAEELLADIKRKESAASGASDGSLESMILARQSKRGGDAASFLDSLAEKYAPKPKKTKGKKK